MFKIDNRLILKKVNDIIESLKQEVDTKKDLDKQSVREILINNIKNVAGQHININNRKYKKGYYEEE